MFCIYDFLLFPQLLFLTTQHQATQAKWWTTFGKYYRHFNITVIVHYDAIQQVIPACPLRELSFESQPLSFYPNNLFPFKKLLLNLLPLQPLDKNKYFHTSLQIFIALNLFPMLTNSSATSLNIVFLYFIKSIHDFSCPDLIVCAPTTLQPLIPHSFKGSEVSHSLVNFFHTFS